MKTALEIDAEVRARAVRLRWHQEQEMPTWHLPLIEARLDLEWRCVPDSTLDRPMPAANYSVAWRIPGQRPWGSVSPCLGGEGSLVWEAYVSCVLPLDRYGLMGEFPFGCRLGLYESPEQAFQVAQEALEAQRRDDAKVEVEVIAPALPAAPGEQGGLWRMKVERR